MSHSFQFLGALKDIETLIDLRVIPGLHMLVPTLENQYLLVFLSFVDILAIWNIFVLTVAVATLAEVRKTKACLTAVIYLALKSWY